MTKEDLAVLRSVPKSRRIYLRGFIKEKSADKFIDNFNELARSPKPIRLVVYSPGGETDAAICIYNAVKQARGPVFGVVGKKASSGALMILQACTVRLARVNASFNIHPNFYAVHVKIWAGMNREERVQQFRDTMEIYEPALMDEWIDSVYPIYKRIEEKGKSQEEFMKFISKDPVLSPKKALEWGLIDDIIGKS